MTEELRQQLIETAVKMNESGLNQGAAGNLSVRYEGGMLITPSGRPYAGLSPEDIIFVGPDGQQEGSGRASSEWRMHRDLYRAREGAGAILHAHPTSCSALACLGEPIPAFHYMVAVAGGRDIPCAPYATFGTQALSDCVLEALADRKACLMANHGLICFASKLSDALLLAIEIEQLARTYLQCRVVGEPVLLEDEEMDRVLERFSDYGAD